MLIHVHKWWNTLVLAHGSKGWKFQLKRGRNVAPNLGFVVVQTMVHGSKTIH
jgi:hypothetical protein